MRILVPILCILMIAGCVGTQTYERGGTMDVNSSAFVEGQPIPAKYSCDGENVNPPLSWVVPDGTVSFAMIVDDPDAPVGTFVHWVAYKIPGDVSAVGENEAPGIEGKNDFGKIGYGGPCPPGGTHRYHFKIYALDTDLDLSEGATKKDLLDAMEGHIIDEGSLMGTYAR